MNAPLVVAHFWQNRGIPDMAHVGLSSRAALAAIEVRVRRMHGASKAIEVLPLPNVSRQEGRPPQIRGGLAHFYPCFQVPFRFVREIWKRVPKRSPKLVGAEACRNI